MTFPCASCGFLTGACWSHRCLAPLGIFGCSDSKSSYEFISIEYLEDVLSSWYTPAKMHL